MIFFQIDFYFFIKNGNFDIIPNQKSVFPLQATLSYKTSQKIYKSMHQILVENESDDNYLNIINILMERFNKESLKKDSVIIPCKELQK